MEKLTCILVDDELHARRLLRTYVERSGSFDIVAECADAVEAREAIQTLNPRVLFLDVQMPGTSGIELLAGLTDPARHLVVFTTAYDQYAISAFNSSAVDYLLKPFEEERFAQAVARIRCMHAGTVAQPSVQNLVASTAEWPERITCRSGARMRVIRVDEILCIEAAGNYCKALLPEGTQLLGASISEIEKKLNPARFLRIHRSAIVNTQAIAAITTHFNGEYKLTLKDGSCAKVSRSYKAVFNKAMGRL